MPEEIWFYRDGDCRAVATNATCEADFLWAASLEMAVMAAGFETSEEQQFEMHAWSPLVHEIAAKLKQGGQRASRVILRAGCPSLTAEHLVHCGAAQ